MTVTFLSSPRDESEASEEANMWHLFFELSYHHELGGAFLIVGVAPRMSATCMSAEMVSPTPR